LFDRFMLDTAMSSEFRRDIEAAIERGAALEEIVGILRKHRDDGTTAAAAAETLEVMRAGADERTEDRLLEILDVATGFCRPEYRVWGES
jgi:hypothetical protein